MIVKRVPVELVVGSPGGRSLREIWLRAMQVRRVVDDVGTEAVTVTLSDVRGEGHSVALLLSDARALAAAIMVAVEQTTAVPTKRLRGKREKRTTLPAAASSVQVFSRVTRVDRSPMNPERWCLTLECGHEQWVTAKRKPKGPRAGVECSECARAASAPPEPRL